MELCVEFVDDSMGKFSKCILQNACSEQAHTKLSILGWEETEMYRTVRRALQKTRKNVRLWAWQVDGKRKEGLTGNISLKKHPPVVKTSCMFDWLIRHE